MTPIIRQRYRLLFSNFNDEYKVRTRRSWSQAVHWFKEYGSIDPSILAEFRLDFEINGAKIYSAQPVLILHDDRFLMPGTGEYSADNPCHLQVFYSKSARSGGSADLRTAAKTPMASHSRISLRVDMTI